ncbi:MAG: glycoside hydrolase family 10 protein [Synechococcales bacterium]|nr:glycoside hydrolase family 10 protein [Synechococcales bacterium]
MKHRSRKRKAVQSILLFLSITWCIVAVHITAMPPALRANPLQQTINTETVGEIRGVWLTNVGSSVLFSPWGVHRALNQLADLNFNTIYSVVWNRGYTFYPSEVTQKVTGQRQAPFFSLLHPNTDLLKEIIRVGHRRQMRVIPWFEYGFMVPRSSQLAVQHPDWLTTNPTGKPGNTPDWALIREGDRQAIEDWQQGQNFWLNPFHPEVQAFILQMIAEVVTHYDVDGIQLDDHFGLPIEMGYDPFTVQLYQQSHQGQSPPTNPSDPAWVRWRADQISTFMGQIAETVKSIKPDCLISLSPNPQDFAYRYYLQDWQRWVQEGWVDELVLQVYRNEPGQVQAELTSASVQAARQRIPVVIGLLSGIFQNPVPISQLQAQIELVRQSQLDGVSFFFWESLLGYLAPESPYQRQRFLKEIFANS